MTDLRTAAQQALKALAGYRRHIGDTQPCDAEIALLDALAQERVEPVACPCGNRRVDQCPGEWESGRDLGSNAKYARRAVQEPVTWLQPKTVDAHTRPDLGYETCSRGDYGAFPVYRASPKAEPEQEPVAWIQPDHLQKARIAPFLCRVEPTQRCADFVPLYLVPPQRKPLTDEEIYKIYNELWRSTEAVDFARAIERAHGIGETK